MSLYDQIGGAAAVDASVDRFYDKILADSRVSSLFDSVDMVRQRKKQKEFLTYAFGGSTKFTGKSLRAAHKDLVKKKLINDREFDAVFQNLRETLQELNVPENLLEQVLTISKSTRNDVLDRNP